MTGLLLAVAALLAVGGLVCLGIWIGLGLAEDRARQAANDALWRRARARAAAPPAARMTLLFEDAATATMSAAGAGAPAALRMPGYAAYLPRAGRGPAALMNAPHAGTSRPPASPDDLDPGVRRTCGEPELYVAALVARTRHAERKYT